MAVKIETIGEWLTNENLKFEQKDNDRIVFGMDNFLIEIETKENGELFSMNMNILNDEKKGFVKIKEHIHITLVLTHLLYLNYSTKFGTWEYDPSDGEIRVAVEIPLEDALMTEKQFKRILSYISDAENGYTEIKKILETGELPEANGPEAHLLALLEELKAVALAQVEEEESGI